MSRTLHLFGTDWGAMMVPIQVIRWYRMQCYDGTDSCATVVPIRRYCHEAYKERYSFQLRNALKNRVGTIANDFKYITREGTTGTLKSIKANYTLIYFNNPDCHDCKRVYNILAGDSPTLAHLVARGELAILALYPDESLTSWNKNKGIYPYNWIVARYARDIDRERYNIPAIPSTYLLDKNKKVIYKDAIIEAVESYLRHKYKL